MRRMSKDRQEELVCGRLCILDSCLRTGSRIEWGLDWCLRHGKARRYDE